jgi:hypothetical protein
MRRWSAVRGPRGIDARIHTKLRVADVSLSAVEVTDETGGESLCRFTWEPGELAVGDRAYFTARGIQHVLDASADVLLRYRLEAVELCDGSGAVIDVLDAVEHLEIGETCDLDVIARLPDRTTAARLIAYRLPDDVVERARERLRREKRAELSARVFESAKYVLIFTTASRERLDAQRCLDGYRLRWQIELQFKRWKSLCGVRLVAQHARRHDAGLALRKGSPRRTARSGWPPSRPSFPPRSGTRPSSSSRPMSCDPWKLTSILWPLLLAALLPFELHDALARLPNIVRRLRRMESPRRRTQRERFRRSELLPWSSAAMSC